MTPFEKWYTATYGISVREGQPTVMVKQAWDAATERAAKILDEYGDSIHPDVAGVAHVMRKITARIRNQEPT